MGGNHVDKNTLSHTTWECKYHIVFAPKFRRQIIYGIMNMILLVCIYYASHFCAKYDKKLAQRYIYLSLIISLVFLVSQIQTLVNYL